MKTTKRLTVAGTASVFLVGTEFPFHPHRILESDTFVESQDEL